MEEFLFSAIKNGNTEVLLKIYKQYRNNFIRWAIAQFKVSIEEAKTVFQEVMLTFQDQINSDQLTALDGDLRTYLFKLGGSKLQAKNHGTENLQRNAGIPAPKVNAGAHHLAQLSERCKQVMLMFYVHGLSLNEVADKLCYKNVEMARDKRYEYFKKLAEVVKMAQHEKY
jgi:DNA-directed RNA polymerase specialized sigma24 family protein